MRYLPETFHTEEKEGQLTVSMEYESAVPETFRCRVEYRISEDRSLEMRIEYPGIQKECVLPLFGMDFKLKKENDRFIYYGLGPEENYADRKRGARLGVYTCTPEKNLAEYLIPQECGNREEVRYLKVMDAQRRGICFEAVDTCFGCSVLPFSAYELEQAMHKEELPARNYTWVRLTAAQCGVGGDDSWGAPIHPQYLVDARRKMELKFRIKPL